jgi:hypothetical protein
MGMEKKRTRDESREEGEGINIWEEYSPSPASKAVKTMVPVSVMTSLYYTLEYAMSTQREE